MEFYSVTEKNEFLLFAGKWMKLENIILNEVSRAQKTKSHLKQMQQYYGMWVTLRGGHAREGWVMQGKDRAGN
jgi:hypothetical protein